MVFCHTRGGGVRGGLTFVTKKWFFFLKAFLSTFVFTKDDEGYERYWIEGGIKLKKK